MTKRAGKPSRTKARTPGVSRVVSRIVQIFLVLIAAGAASLGLIGQIGRFEPAADAVNYFMPIWAVVGVGAALGLMLFRGWSRSAGFVVATILFATAGPALLRGIGEFAEPGEPELRIVQFNLLKGNTAPDQAAAWILAQKPDIVILEEAALNGARVRDQVRTQLPYAVDCLGAETLCSTVILSRRAPVQSGGLAKGDPENQSALSAAWARFDAPDGGAFTVVGVHMGRPWPFGVQEPTLAILHAFTALQDPHSLIVAGDFNLPPWTFAMQRQDRLLALPRLTGRQPTWPAGTATGWRGIHLPPILPIDHVYAGDDWIPTRIALGPVLGSDHRPVVIELARRR